MLMIKGSDDRGRNGRFRCSAGLCFLALSLATPSLAQNSCEPRAALSQPELDQTFVGKTARLTRILDDVDVDIRLRSDGSARFVDYAGQTHQGTWYHSDPPFVCTSFETTSLSGCYQIAPYDDCGEVRYVMWSDAGVATYEVTGFREDDLRVPPAEASVNWSPVDIRRHQRALTWTQSYLGAIDGLQGPAYASAVSQFQERWLQEQPTGQLSARQATALTEKALDVRIELGMSRQDFPTFGVSVDLPMTLLGPRATYPTNAYFPPTAQGRAADAMKVIVAGGYMERAQWEQARHVVLDKYNRSVVPGLVDQGRDYVFVRYFEDLPGAGSSSFDLGESVAFYLFHNGEVRGVEMTWATGRDFIADPESTYFYRHRFTAAAMVNSVEAIPMQRGSSTDYDAFIDFVIEEAMKALIQRATWGLARRIFR